MDRLEPLPSVSVETFGCKVNTYDTGLIQHKLEQAGFQFSTSATEVAETGGGRRIHVLNSCAVTAEATAQALRQARRLKREDPDSFVVVTGCSAQVDTERFQDVDSVDLVVANSHKGELPELLKRLSAGETLDRVYKSNIFKKEDVEAGGGEELGHTRSFLKIQDGCDSFCTFCVIPFARGKSRSIEPEALAAKIQEIESRGVNEVVLTGVHIGDYVSKDGRGLADLVEYVLQNTKVPRIRLSSLEPVELTLPLIELYDDPRMCSHFHMSIQSVSTTVLSKMKRKYSAQQVTDALLMLADKVPCAYVGMDVIAGFPEESEQEFEDTFKRLSDAPWTRLHVFPYSARPNTYAARALKTIEHSLVKERAARLRQLSADRHATHAISQIGQEKKVLWLKHNASKTALPQGLARDYWTVILNEVPQRQAWNDQETSVLITGCDRQEGRTGELKLYGKLL
ncbi:MAG: tRNA (N(6)-L-threonylcarbamoyladenosine(37)-C(2))-methylthiotransferase MtaB [Bdellovibrionales bacterium]